MPHPEALTLSSCRRKPGFLTTPTVVVKPNSIDSMGLDAYEMVSLRRSHMHLLIMLLGRLLLIGEKQL